MLKKDSIWPYLVYENFSIVPFFSSELNYVSLHLVQNYETIYKTDLMQVKKLLKELEKKETYEIANIKVPSRDIKKLIYEAIGKI